MALPQKTIPQEPQANDLYIFSKDENQKGNRQKEKFSCFQHQLMNSGVDYCNIFGSVSGHVIINL